MPEVRRRLWGSLGLLLGAAMLTPTSGCASPTGKAEVLLAGAAPPQSRLKTKFVSAAFMQTPASTSIYLSDVPLESLLDPQTTVVQIAHIELLWRPVPGMTPVEFDSINTSIRHVILVDGEVGIYGGAGFAWFKGKPDAKKLRIVTQGATIALLQATEGFEDLLSPAEYEGEVVAVNDPALAMRIRQAVAQRVTDAFGVPRFVRRDSFEIDPPAALTEGSYERWLARIGSVLQSLDPSGQPTLLVDDHQGPAEHLPPLPHLVGHVHAGGHVAQHGSRVAADDAVVRTAHAHIGDEGGALAQDPGVGRGHVGVGPEHGGHAPVQMMGQGRLLAGGFHVGLDDHDGVGLGQLAQDPIHRGEGVVGRQRKPDSTEHGDDKDAARPTIGRRNPGPAPSHRSIGEVGRTGDRCLRGLQDLQDPGISIAVVAEGEGVDAQGPQGLEEIRRESAPGTGVLGIGHHDVRTVLLSQPRKLLLDHASARRAVDVSQEGHRDEHWPE